MALSSDDDGVRSWANEIIEDEFTAVNSYQPICSDNVDDNSKLFQKHFSMHQNSHYVYGILIGFNYNDINEEHCRKIFSIVSSYFPIELIVRINSLNNNNYNDDKCYGNILLETFNMMEQSIRDNMDEILSEKTALELSLSDKDPTDYPLIQKQLNTYSQKLSFGFSCVITIINSEKIYVANIGDTRAFVCCSKNNSMDSNQIDSYELSNCHNLNNPKELERLKNISIETDILRLQEKIGNMNLTRCLGNIKLKDFYKDYSELSDAISEPILSEPSIKSFRIDNSCRFLLLISSNLFKALQHHNSDDDHECVNHLISIINEELENNKSDFKNIPDLILQKIFQQQQQLNEPFYSTPILMIRLFQHDHNNYENDDGYNTSDVKTVITPPDEHSPFDRTRSNDSNSSCKQEAEIPSHVDLSPLIEALKVHNIDYDDF